MKKIGFVIPWYGENIPGGAENSLKGIVEHLRNAGMDVEILTTRVKQFDSDWNKNYYSKGIQLINNVPVRRFNVTKGNRRNFGDVNLKLMNHLPITYEEEEIFLRECVNSKALYGYIREHQAEYDLFVFTPYMFGTTYYGVQEVREKAVLIPCFHDESYFYMKHFKEGFSKVKGMVFMSEPEKLLAESAYQIEDVQKAVLGTGVNTENIGNAIAFRKKYNINKPFLLYAGRKDAGKNVNLLLEYYKNYVLRKGSDIELVLIGGGQIDIPDVICSHVHDLGYLPIQDKYDAYAAALALCNPSNNESFSIVIMESWICGRPVLVSEKCAVTKDFVKRAQGGLYFKDYADFEGTLNYFLQHGNVAEIMGQNGKCFVKQNFAWDVIRDRYTEFFLQISGAN